MMQMDGSIAENTREEAMRAKAIAGAKEFVVKAQKLNPELCGLLGLNTVLDVRMRFEKKINGEVDWYAVLAVDPTADLVTILRRYRKLGNAIKGDKDNSVGSIVEAQKILVDAFRYLSNEKVQKLKEKRREEIRLSRISGGGSKQKGPPSTDLRRNCKDAGRHDRLELTPNMVRSALVGKTASSIKRYVFASQHKNAGAAAETKSLQDSKKCNAAKRVKIESKNTDNMVTEEEPNVVMMNVPDPDFYNFDEDRTEASFGKNEVWAAYDDRDGMPRFYALVHSVVSQEPFKLRVSWLYSKKNEELGPMKWIDSGFYKTSGHFFIGKRSNNESLNSLSHRVQWKKGANGFVHIYPKKSDVWALYANWSPFWDSSTPKEVVYKYEMVEVLQDFDEEGGVTVAPLVKVPGFQTVFRHHLISRTFPRKELFRFSHQVASHLLTGQEGKNAPEGCLELDPAALSPELLKVVTEEEIAVKKQKEEVDEVDKRREETVKKPNEEVDVVVETMNKVGMDDEAMKEIERESNKEKKN